MLCNVIVVGIVRSLFAYLYGLLQHHSRIHTQHEHKLTEVYSSFSLCVVLSCYICISMWVCLCFCFCFSSLHFFSFFFVVNIFNFAYKHLAFVYCAYIVVARVSQLLICLVFLCQKHQFVCTVCMCQIFTLQNKKIHFD